MSSTAPDQTFERIYRRHARDVYRFALAVVRNPTEAEDVTQTTFLNAYRALKRGDEPARARSWLFAIAHNAIRSRYRWTLRRPKEVPLEQEAHHLAVADEERETVVDVLKALGELPENQRAALAMRELEGLSYPEIATTLGVSVPAVESLISRGRRTLRAQRTKLRSLTVLQLPASLRSLIEQGTATNVGLAARAAAAVAAATVLAGGAAVVTHDAGASKRPHQSQRNEPASALALWGLALPAGRAAVAAPIREQATQRRSKASAPQGPTSSHPAVPDGGAADAAATASPAPAPAPAPPAKETTTVSAPAGPAVTYEPPKRPTAPKLPAAPSLPTPPSSLDPHTVQAPTLPTPPALPTPPSLPSPPTVTLPAP